MKKIILSTLTLIVMASTAMASDSKCKVELSDMTITGRGPSSAAAFEDAATQCFDQRAAKFKAKHGHLDEDTGLIYIDQCANVKCS